MSDFTRTLVLIIGLGALYALFTGIAPITAEPTPTRRILRAEYVLITDVVTPTPTTEVGR